MNHVVNYLWLALFLAIEIGWIWCIVKFIIWLFF